MAVTIRCQHCGQRYSVREDLLGKQIKCKACGQAMTIAAEPAAPKTAQGKPTSSPAAARPAARTASPSNAGKPAAATARPKQAATAAASAAKNVSSQAPPAVDPLGAAAPAVDPLFAPANNLLDLLNDAALPAAGAAPLGSGVVLKGSKPAAAAQPKVKKKQKKKASGGVSIQTKTTLRMMWGAVIVLFGLGAFGMAIACVVSDDDSGFKGKHAIRWSLLGFSVVGSGLKLIVG